jgi:two-component system, chemotaxis family, sensor kinase Cph1
MSMDPTELEACAREPIRIPGAIQPHGTLLVLDGEHLSILQAAANAEKLVGVSLRHGQPLPEPLAPLREQLAKWSGSTEPALQTRLSLDRGAMVVAAHRAGDRLIVEFEQPPDADELPMDELFPRLKAFAEGLSDGRGGIDAPDHMARFVRDLTDFDRVLVYRFDREWNGHVIAEAGNGVLPSYLDLRFPAADIPAQARDLYRLNRLRLIPDVDYEPVPLEPRDDPRNGEPIDLSLAQLRSVSPVHLEYMRNMGTNASMSVSILVDGALWGLVACHSRNPHLVSLNIRSACDFAVQAFATRIASRERALQDSQQIGLNAITHRLLASIAAEDDWADGLVAEGDALLRQVEAGGCAVVSGGEMTIVGDAPGETEIRAMLDWLTERDVADFFATDGLSSQMEGAERSADRASGLMAIRISEVQPHWVLWFRPEVVQMVTWAGDPHKVVRESGRIHPRHSFAAWKEQVRYHARGWSDAEKAAAMELRNSIVGIVLRNAEELGQLTEELQRSNKELEAFSYSVSHDLRAPFRHIVGFSELLREREKNLDEKSRHYLENIADSAIAAGRLVDDLLNFSHLGRASLKFGNVDMNKIVMEVRRSAELAAPDRRIEWVVGDLPTAWGDPTFIRQVWQNLIENAVKYTKREDLARIEIDGWAEGEETHYRVRDNGVGFDMTYIEKMFGVFQRLQRAEDFEGTGIGLALVRRILERHNGRIFAEGEVEKGADFTFALPSRKKDD